MNCTICGKQMNYTGFGNYHCQECGHAMNDLVNRPSNCDMPMPQGFGKQEGWICPVCGRGLAPWTSFCPCQGSEIKITYGTSTGEDIFSPIPMRVFDPHTCKYHTEYPPGWKVGDT